MPVFSWMKVNGWRCLIMVKEKNSVIVKPFARRRETSIVKYLFGLGG